ncbi:hypothetical protein R1sor_016679 [Riccia sorocarpa]|uniref:Uncharacterized protein n=1 Tax=Riccia sorocarpa TaxID=122646 RepID=A0ABD3HJ91_9MARC
MPCCRVQTSAVLVGNVSRSILGDGNSSSSVSVSFRIGQWFMSREVGIRSYSAALAASRRRSRGDRQVERPCPCLSAKRKSSTADLNTEDELDEDLRTGLNEVSTEALKVMLGEDGKVLEQFREKVDYLGEYLVQEGHLDAARFMLVLRGMLDHEVYPQKDELKGAYKKAFDTIAALIEDSGWVLKRAGRDVGGVEMVDDELIPPVLNTRI